MLFVPTIYELRFLGACLLMFAGSIKRPNCSIGNILISCAVLLVAFGLKHCAFISLVVILNLALIKIFQNEYAYIALNMGFLYLYKIFGKRVVSDIHGTFDISGFLMVLIVKMSYLASEYREIKDSNKMDTDKNTQKVERKENAAVEEKNTELTAILKKEGASYMNMLYYIMFLPTLLSGPTTSYKEFLAADKTVKKKILKSDITHTIISFAIFGCFKNVPFKQWIASDKTHAPMRLVYLYLFNLVNRMKFHFIWNFANMCFFLHGIDNMLNINFNKVEFTSSVREISSHWNIFVSRWVKNFFFVPLKPRGTFLAAILSFSASACLHGVNLCYLIFFLSFGVFSGVITKINKHINNPLFARIQMVFFVSFFSLPFYLLDVKELWSIWKALGFYGLYYCVGFMAIFYLYEKYYALETASINKSK
ncbi:lysophospholipid acyltransferase [Enteropsectra breve]|nr:lysophospholipid acyltransferase [Enteropsectra breve]